MEILPTDSELIVEVKLKPIDIAHIREGLSAAIKLDAYDFAIYGVLDGVVNYVSPDALVENGRYGEEVYYRVHVRIRERLSGQTMWAQVNKPIEIQPGMTASVDIRTGRRTVLSYLTKPISRMLAESLSER